LIEQINEYAIKQGLKLKNSY